MGFELWTNPEVWRSRVRQSAITGRPVDVSGLGELPRNYPKPPPEPIVRVVALTSNWCVAGRRVEVGEVYSLPAQTAAALEWAGKAKAT
jgi:hypothetical protein